MILIKNITKKISFCNSTRQYFLKHKRKRFFRIGWVQNGAGKSTLMNLMVGYMNSDAGEISINNRKVSQDNLELRSIIGLVPNRLLYTMIFQLRKILKYSGVFFISTKKILKKK